MLDAAELLLAVATVLKDLEQFHQGEVSRLGQDLRRNPREERPSSHACVGGPGGGDLLVKQDGRTRIHPWSSTLARLPPTHAAAVLVQRPELVDGARASRHDWLQAHGEIVNGRRHALAGGKRRRSRLEDALAGLARGEALAQRLQTLQHLRLLSLLDAGVNVAEAPRLLELLPGPARTLPHIAENVGRALEEERWHHEPTGRAEVCAVQNVALQILEECPQDRRHRDERPEDAGDDPDAETREIQRLGQGTTALYRAWVRKAARYHGRRDATRSHATAALQE
mmetsp:Transcript_13122/g.35136  ORF Transcript_13122/g.35136 Transcript_13122/m.35136 type:complete len:283 (+) Transcript_13122:719-1567(+)